MLRFGSDLLAIVTRWRELPVVESLLCGNALGKDAPSWECGPPGDAGPLGMRGLLPSMAALSGIRREGVCEKISSCGEMLPVGIPVGIPMGRCPSLR